MSKRVTIHVPKSEPRNHVAREMILSGTGKSQIMRDRRNRRPKDARREREHFDY